MATVETTVDYGDEDTIITITSTLPVLEVEDVDIAAANGETLVYHHQTNIADILSKLDRHAARIRAAVAVE